jgi:hypothetical protein
MASYAQQDEDRWIHKLASISRELGYPISPKLPQELLLSPTDRLQSCSLCQRAMPSLYRIHTSDGQAAQNIIREISVRITTEMSMSSGRCCVGEHTPECARDSRFLDDFMEPAYRLHLGRRGIPLCFACYAGAPQASVDPQPRTAYSVLAERTLTRWPTFFETPDGPLRRAETMPTPTTTPEAHIPNPPPCNTRRASLRTRPNPALKAHEQSSSRHAKGIFTMDEIRAAIILDQHQASTTPEARTRRPTLANTWPLHP